MNKNRLLRSVFFVLVSAGILYFLKWRLDSQPMQFLFMTGILLSGLFFIIQNKRAQRAENGTLADKRVMKENRVVSVVFLLFLFVLSLVVLKKYQHPSGEKPYFDNTAHHAIKNKGALFNNRLCLYDEETNANEGLWKSEKGRFDIIADQRNIRFEFSNFLTPVFLVKDKKTKLINPVYNQDVEKGFAVGDDKTKIEITKFERVDEGGGIYSYNIDAEFRTTDVDMVRKIDTTFPSTIFSYEDRFNVSEFPVNKGLKLRDLLSKMTSIKPLSHEITDKWFDNLQCDMYLLNEEEDSKKSLAFFPDSAFFNPDYHLYASFNGSKLSPTTSVSYSYGVLAYGAENPKFYVGFSGSRKPMSVEAPDSLETKHYPGQNAILRFDYPEYYSLASHYDENDQVGNEQLRFLRNSYSEEVGAGKLMTEEGFFFHDDFKENPYTNIETYLSYTIGKPGTPLYPSLISFSENDIHSSMNNDEFWESGHNKYFALTSKNQQLAWVFEIRDFSQNGFAFGKSMWFLAIIMFSFLVLVIFFPSIELQRIETPLIIAIYCMIVFRLLLLWRVATFPPLDDIVATEFDTLQYFDFRLAGSFVSPIPFTVIFPVFIVLLICLFRAFSHKFQSANKATANIPFEKWKPVLIHLIVLFSCFIVVKVLRSDMYVRVCSIILPIISYFILSSRVISRKINFQHNSTWHRFKPVSYFREMLAFWIETPVFFLSLTTLVFLGLTDTGFAIIFMFFLLLKNILVNFSRRPRRQGDSPIALFLRPQNYWIYGIFFFALYLIIVSNKSFFDWLLVHKIWLFCGMVFFVFMVLYTFLQNKKIILGAAIASMVIICSLLFVTPLKKFVEKKVDDKIRLTVYRTQILTRPINEILFQFEFNSNKEKKLIETAENQWYIANYMDAPRKNEIIHLRPHFNTGVDYSTQTRDVVLPRYVISEFGGFMMALVLVMLALPTLLFTLQYKIVNPTDCRVEKNRFVSVLHPGSFIAISALVLLFTIALLVWLASTNRIVFFGQDFPFLSLTSKVSVMTPMILIFFVLISRPPERERIQRNYTSFAIRWAGFIVLMTGVIYLSKKPNNFADKNKNFSIDYKDVKLTVNDTLNNLLSDYQDSLRTAGSPIMNEQNMASGKSLEKIMDGLFKHETTKTILENAKVSNPYLASMLDSLQKNPLSGQRVSAPIYIKRNLISDKYELVFNDHLNTEAPPYDIEGEWKGDLKAQNLSTELKSKVPGYHNKETTNSSFPLLSVPESYQPQGSRQAGILYYNKSSTSTHRQISEILVYNEKTKKINYYKPDLNGIGSILITADDHVLLRTGDKNKKTIEKISLPENGGKYFAKNHIINGKRRFVYPLGSRYYWIRNWATACTQNHRDSQKVDSVITLDYDLTQKVITELARIKNEANIPPKVSFSVMAADGNGKIRLMADYVRGRKEVNPNSEKTIQRMQMEEFFNFDSQKEADQWGNKNLIRMKLGPGSSVKPLISAVITAGVKAEWENLKLNNITGITGGKPFRIDHYAGVVSKWEETHIKTDCLLKDYIIHSDNLYHSALLFLGSYSRNDFDNQSPSLYNVLTTHGNAVDKNDYPDLKISGSPVFFYSKKTDAAKWPHSNGGSILDTNYYFGNDNSLLARGLRDNLHLKTEKQFVNYDLQKEPYGPGNIFQPSIPLAYPDVSGFDISLMKYNRANENFGNCFKIPAHGGHPYEMTPKKMTDMYGALFSQNPNYYTTLLPSDKINYSTTWYIDPSWKGAYENFLTKNIVGGMEEVISIGTASSRLQEFKAATKQYHFYAKTGTISEQDKGIDYKRLALIITKEPVTASNMKSNRFFVVFFTIDNAEYDKGLNGWFWGSTKYYNNIINMILESDSFKTYMNAP